MNRQIVHRLVGGLLCILLVVAVWAGTHWLQPVYGAELGDRSLRLGDSSASAESTYQVSFEVVTPGALGSIVLEFCSNDPIPGQPCTAPPGFDAASATLASQAGASGFTIGGSSTSHRIVLTRAPVVTGTDTLQFVFEDITNPSTPGSYFVRLQTYASSDATGPDTDYGGLVFSITNPIAITATVPPYLLFCTGLTIGNFNCANAEGDTIDFGNLSSVRALSGSSQLLVATNAANGYNVTAFGTTLTSGNNIINPLTNGDVSRPATSQFGLNLRANGTPAIGNDPAGPGVGQPTVGYAQANRFRFASGETIISSPDPDNVRLYTVSYMVNVSATQPAGVYASTITYIALANF